jgi:hypothetical protein
MGGFEHHELPAAMANIHRLCKLTTVFPSPDQMIWNGHKLAVISQLQLIAKEHTRTPYPKIVQIQNPRAFDFKDRENLYIKREFSESSRHVLKVRSGKKFMKEFQSLVEDTERLYGHKSIRDMGIQVRWFGMSYVDGLQTLGEIRVYFVGGNMSHTVLTEVKDEDDIMESAVEHFTPLHVIEQVFIPLSLVI